MNVTLENYCFFRYRVLRRRKSSSTESAKAARKKTKRAKKSLKSRENPEISNDCESRDHQSKQSQEIISDEKVLSHQVESDCEVLKSAENQEKKNNDRPGNNLRILKNTLKYL